MVDIVRTERIAYRYPQNGHGLAATSLAVQPGQVLLVTGPSGCGKSTLARCLTGLIPHLYRGHLTGEAWVDGLSTRDAPLWQLAERAGMVFQNPSAQMLSPCAEEEITLGLETLGLGRESIGARLEAALSRFGLQPLRYRSPSTLSGGEQQKLALASIMARRPPVLVLDEPLSMLDSTAATELVDHLTALSEAGTAVVVCEHRKEWLERVPGLRHLRLEGSSHPGPSLPDGSRPYPLPERPPFELHISDLGVELGGRSIVRGLNLRLRGGQVVAVVGRNGVGKTTLLRALAGLQSHSGRVTVDGPRRPRLGMVFENPDLQLFNPSVRDEILYRVAEPDANRYAWLIEALGLGCYEETPPLLLSEGEKKRLALATVLMRGDHDGVLLDEPMLGQDASHKARLVAVARALAHSGHLVIMTTHDLDLAVRADRLLLLGHDGLVADGTPEAVLRDVKAWRRLGMVIPDWVRPPVRTSQPVGHCAGGERRD